jgi:hypothetical protein
MSPDSYDGSYDYSNPQSLNRYAYVGNNPLGFTDPTGLQNGEPPPASGGGDCGIICVGIDIGITALASEIASLFDQPSFHGTLHPRPGTGQFVTASLMGNPTLENGVYTLQVAEYGTTLNIPVGSFTYGGTLTQFLTAASASGFYESKADYVTGIHSGMQLRSNNNFCNLHVTDVMDASTPDGPAVTGNAHFDLVNPAPQTPDYVFFYPRILVHGVLDYGVDKSLKSLEYLAH